MGKVVWEASYEAYGKLVHENGTVSFKASFTGKQIDEDTGLYYFNARWYDAELGRFVTEDPARDGTNWYEYCKNNPLKYMDPTGLDDEEINKKNEGSEATATSTTTTSTDDDDDDDEESSNVNKTTVTTTTTGSGSSSGGDSSSSTTTATDTAPTVTIIDTPATTQDKGLNVQRQIDSTTLPQGNQDGYKGLRGKAMKLGENLRGKEVLSFIGINSDLIQTLSNQRGVDQDLVKAIIYEEQTHNKTPGIFEDILPVNSVGPMAINKKYWDGLSKKEMQKVLPNIGLGIEILAESQKRILDKNHDASVAQIASNYNNENAVTITTDYGRRVESFYYWFENK